MSTIVQTEVKKTVSSSAIQHLKPSPLAGNAQNHEHALPPLPSFEELGISASFQKAVEEELTQNEELLWLGRPSQNEAVHPPKTALVVIGAVLFGLAILLPLVFKSLPIFFPMILIAFGFFFLFAPKLFKGTNRYQACYVVTNRRAILFEKGILGLDRRNLTSLKNSTGIHCKSYHPHELLGMQRRNNDRIPGAGDLIFEYIFTIGQNSAAFPGSTGTLQRTDTPQRTPRGFFFLDQVAEVENVIRTSLLGNLEKSVDVGVAASSTPSLPEPVATLESYREDGVVAPEIKEKILAELDANERLIWIAQPVGAIVFRRSLGYLAGGCVLAFLAVLWFVGARFIQTPFGAIAVNKGMAVPRPIPMKKQPIPAPQTKSAPASQGLAVLPICMMGVALGFIVVPFYRWWKAHRSCYALTNRRALVLRQGLFGLARESYSPIEVSQMRRSDSWLFHAGGDLIFNTVTTIRSSYSRRGFSQSVSKTHYGFLAIADVREVEKRVREVLIDPFVNKLQMANN